MATSTPWGASQESRSYGRGVTFYSTASHGGYRVCPTVNRTVPDHLRVESGWYEEDSDWARVALAFPDRFSAEEREAAEQTLKGWAPAAWERQYGRTLAPGESFVRDQELFAAAHVDDLVGIAAVGDWAEGVPAGFVQVTTRVGGRTCTSDAHACGGDREFLVPAGEYDQRTPYGFVVDTNRHQEVPRG